MTTLSANQIAAAAQQAGFSGQDLVIAIAVALAESSGNPSATHSNSNGSVDYGLWQINSVHASLVAGNWADPTSNAKMAYSVWQGSGWSAWTTYTSGAYLKYMGQASAAANAPDTSGIQLTASTSSDSTGEAGSIGSIGDFFTWIATPSNWVRVGYFFGGLLALIIGTVIIMKRTGTLKKLGKGAMAVAEVVK